MAFGTIGGNLPFGGGGGDYASAYASSLAMNQANYNNVLSGYQQLGQQQQAAQHQVSVGYDNLQSGVLGSIQGIDRSQRQAIADQYAKNIGQQSQQLISRGLGNSTVQSSVERGLLFDKTKSDIALTNATQGLNAQYMNQTGMAALQYQDQANRNNVGLASQQLQFMNSVQAGYPDARAFAELARMKGASGGGGYGGGGWTSSGVSAGKPLGLNPNFGNAPSSGFAGSTGYGGATAASQGYNYANSPSSIYPGANPNGGYDYTQGGEADLYGYGGDPYKERDWNASSDYGSDPQPWDEGY